MSISVHHGDLVLERGSEGILLQLHGGLGVLSQRASWESFSPFPLHGVPHLVLAPGAYGKSFPDESPGNLGLIQVPHTPLLGLMVCPRTL